MTRVRNLAELALYVVFSEFDFYDLNMSLPLHEIAEAFDLWKTRARVTPAPIRI